MGINGRASSTKAVPAIASAIAEAAPVSKSRRPLLTVTQLSGHASLAAPLYPQPGPVAVICRRCFAPSPVANTKRTPVGSALMHVNRTNYCDPVKKLNHPSLHFQ